jgi:hypothetical protein
MLVSVSACKLLIWLRPVRERDSKIPVDQPATGFFLRIVHRWILKCELLKHRGVRLGNLVIQSYAIHLQPTLVAVSNKIAFANPKAPVYPRLALGKTWNEVDFWHILVIICWLGNLLCE